MMINMIHNKYRLISNTLMISTLLIATLPYTPLNRLYKGENFYGRFMPFLWISFCIIIWFLPKMHPIGRIRKRDSIFFDTIVCATIFLASRIVAGLLIDNFGKSPYDLSIMGILVNFIRVTPELIAKEYTRSYCLCTYCRRGVNKTFWIITVLMAFSNLSVESFYPLSKAEDFMKVFAEHLGPELSISVLLSYFALYGGVKCSLMYLGIMEAFLRISPAIPILQWITEGVISIAIPIVEALYLSGKYEQERQKIPITRESIYQTISWTITLGFSVLLIWFVIGVFPIYPNIIVTGSMRPLIKEGDVILIEKITEEQDIYNLKEGDIIQFSRDEVMITHRIVEIVKDKVGNITFRTKGDNNTTEDVRLVLPAEVRGTLVKVVPKVGLPSLWLRIIDEEQPDGVEN